MTDWFILLFIQQVLLNNCFSYYWNLNLLDNKAPILNFYLHDYFHFYFHFIFICTNALKAHSKEHSRAFYNGISDNILCIVLY